MATRQMKPAARARPKPATPLHLITTSAAASPSQAPTLCDHHRQTKSPPPAPVLLLRGQGQQHQDGPGKTILIKQAGVGAVDAVAEVLVEGQQHHHPARGAPPGRRRSGRPGEHRR